MKTDRDPLKLVPIPDSVDYDRLKRAVLRTVIGVRCSFCQRTISLNTGVKTDYLVTPSKLDGFWVAGDGWTPIDQILPGTVIASICCRDSSYWAVWAKRWKYRQRNRLKRLRRK